MNCLLDLVGAYRLDTNLVIYIYRELGISFPFQRILRYYSFNSSKLTEKA